MKERTRNVKGQHHIKNMDNIFLGENLADFDRFKKDLGLDMKSDNVIKYSEKKSGLYSKIFLHLRRMNTLLVALQLHM